MHGCGAGCRAVQMPIRRATRTLDSMGCTQMWRQHSLRWEKQPHLCSEPVLSHCAPLWCVDISKAAQESKPEAGTVFWFLDSFMFWNCLLINTNISRRGLLKIGNFQNECVSEICSWHYLYILEWGSNPQLSQTVTMMVTHTEIAQGC